MPHTDQDLELLVKTYSFDEAYAFSTEQNQKKEAVNSGRSVYEYANCYFRLRKQKKAPPGDHEDEGDEQGEVGLDPTGILKATEFSDRISSFVIHGAAKVYVDKNAFIRADLVTSDGKVNGNIFIPPEAWRSRQALMKVLTDTKYEFKGTDNDVQDIMWLATKNIKDEDAKKGVEYIGFSEGCFAGPGFTLGKEGPIENPPVEYITQGIPLEKAIAIQEHENPKGLLEEFAATALKINKPQVIVPALAWMFACFFKGRIQDTIEYFPILSFFGTSGAGKTSLVVSLLRIFGITKRKALFNAHATEFSATRMLASSNCIPLAVDEMKEDLGKQIIDAWKSRLRSAFFGEIVTRGRQDLSVRSFPLLSPLLIMGEMSVVREQAIVERTIAVEPKRSDINEEARQSFNQFRKAPIHCLFPEIVKWRLGEGEERFAELWNRANQKLHNMKLPWLPDRVWDNLTVLTFGLEVIEVFSESMGVKFEIPDALKKEAFTFLTERVLQVSSRTKMGFDSFLEALAIMAKNEIIKSQRDYEATGEWLYFHLSSCVSAFRKWARETNYGGEILDEREYKNQAREIERMTAGRYVHDISKVWRFGDKTMRCVQISLRRAERAGLDIAGFGWTLEKAPDNTYTPPLPEGDSTDEKGQEYQLPLELTEPRPEEQTTDQTEEQPTKETEGDIFGEDES